MANQQQPFQPPYPYVPMAKRRRGWILPVVIIAIVLFVISLPFIFFGIFISSVASIDKEPVDVQKNTVLVLNLNNFSETPGENPLAIFSGNKSSNTVFDLINAIKAAKTDSRIEGIYLKAGIGNYGFAKADEIMNALLDFKKSGKFVYSYLPFSNENTYYIASASDSIFAPTMGFFEINGYGSSPLFLKNFFDKIGVNFYVEHFEDFKSAGESFSRASYSDSSKKQIRVLLEQRFDEFVQKVVENRKIDKATLLAAINRGQYTADSLKSLGLLDGYATPEEFEIKVYERIFGMPPVDEDTETDGNGKIINEKVHYLNITNYAGTDIPKKGEVYNKDVKIAIIQAAGTISSDSQGITPSSNNEGITDTKMINYLEDARKDKKIKAIIIRIDSPGGSALASDNIWQEIMKVRKEKPVYASMSDVAASGGYYISMACDTILAYPNTITGSIGVISLVPNVSGLMGKLGLTTDTINVGNNSQFMNGMFPYTDKDKAKFRAAMQTIYFDFVGKAAQNRHKKFDELRSIAKGRVWSGKDAKDLGLVDMLGTYQDAINLAKNRIGVPADKKVKVEMYPKPEDQLAEFIKFVKGLGDMNAQTISSKLSLLGFDKTQAETYSKILNLLPEGMKMQVKYNLELMEISRNNNVLLTMPFYPNFN